MDESPPKRARGDRKPTFKPTPKLRNRVAIAAGAGMAHADIATALGICRNTLEKYFADELAGVALARRMEVLEKLHESAVKEGSVAAAKAYLAMEPKYAPPPLAPGAKPEAPKPEADAKPGKKEQAQIDATTAASGDPEWARILGKSAVQ